MFFFSQKNKEETVAVFDIASGSVGGAMVLLQPNKKPTIISSIRRTFPTVDTNLSDMRSMLGALQEVLHILQKDVHVVPDNVFVGISSPWAAGELRSIQRHRKEEFVCTEVYVKQLVKEEIAIFKKQRSEFNEIIDRRVTNILLNGYEVPKPYGKRIKKLEIQLFLSLSSREVISKIEEVIIKTYNRHIKCTSSLFSDFIVVRDMFDHTNDFMIINIHEESTEVSIMRNDFLVGTSSFPYGKQTLIRHVAKNLGKNLVETASLLSMYKHGHLDDSYTKRIAESIHTEGALWIRAIKTVFRSLSIDTLIPHQIFLVTDASSGDWFLHLLQKNNFSEFTTTENTFDVILANSKNLHDFYAVAMNVDYDARMAMQTIFISNITNK